MALEELKYPTVPLDLGKEQRYYLSAILAAHKLHSVGVVYREEPSSLAALGERKGLVFNRPLEMVLDAETLQLLKEGRQDMGDFGYRNAVEHGLGVNKKEAEALVNDIWIESGNLQEIQRRLNRALEFVDDARPISGSAGRITTEFLIRVQLYQAGAHGGIYLPKIGLVYPVRFADEMLEKKLTVATG